MKTHNFDEKLSVCDDFNSPLWLTFILVKTPSYYGESLLLQCKFVTKLRSLGAKVSKIKKIVEFSTKGLTSPPPLVETSPTVWE